MLEAENCSVCIRLRHENFVGLLLATIPFSRSNSTVATATDGRSVVSCFNPAGLFRFSCAGEGTKQTITPTMVPATAKVLDRYGSVIGGCWWM